MLYVHRVIESHHHSQELRYVIVDTDDRTETTVTWSELEKVVCKMGIEVLGTYTKQASVVRNGKQQSVKKLNIVEVYKGQGRLPDSCLMRVKG